MSSEAGLLEKGKGKIAHNRVISSGIDKVSRIYELIILESIILLKQLWKKAPRSLWG